MSSVKYTRYTPLSTVARCRVGTVRESELRYWEGVLMGEMPPNTERIILTNELPSYVRLRDPRFYTQGGSAELLAIAAKKVAGREIPVEFQQTKNRKYIYGYTIEYVVADDDDAAGYQSIGVQS